MSFLGEPGSARQEAERLVAAVLATATMAANATPNLSTGSAECCVCPLCKVIAAIRDPDPEMVERVAAGAGDLAVGVASFLRHVAAASPSPSPSAPPPQPATSSGASGASRSGRESGAPASGRGPGAPASGRESGVPPAKKVVKKAVKKPPPIRNAAKQAAPKKAALKKAAPKKAG